MASEEERSSRSTGRPRGRLQQREKGGQSQTSNVLAWVITTHRTQRSPTPPMTKFLTGLSSGTSGKTDQTAFQDQKFGNGLWNEYVCANSQSGSVEIAARQLDSLSAARARAVAKNASSCNFILKILSWKFLNKNFHF
mmetsp:Transcript_26120/g.51505  ORF Transcript_26120/g.51505 Transcript_26120/m.51505 type:complete len:138 (+) Transcript_26120:1260-1673(+)